MKVLVTGGAGYIGSVVVEQLIKHGHEVVVYDNLSKGHAAAIASEASLVKADLSDRDMLVRALDRNRIEAVIHMAASSLVGESVENPNLYLTNNVSSAVSLLDAMLPGGLRNPVFSPTPPVSAPQEPPRIPT